MNQNSISNQCKQKIVFLSLFFPFCMSVFPLASDDCLVALLLTFILYCWQRCPGVHISTAKPWESNKVTISSNKAQYNNSITLISDWLGVRKKRFQQMIHEMAVSLVCGRTQLRIIFLLKKIKAMPFYFSYIWFEALKAKDHH